MWVWDSRYLLAMMDSLCPYQKLRKKFEKVGSQGSQKVLGRESIKFEITGVAYEVLWF